MAVTQTAASQYGLTYIAQQDDDGYYYNTIGGIRIYVGSGSPHTIITAPKGSVYIEVASGALWVNTNAIKTWAEAT